MKSLLNLAATFLICSCYAQDLPAVPVAQGKDAKFRKYDLGTNILGFFEWHNQRYLLELRKTKEGSTWIKSSINYYKNAEETRSIIIASTDSTIEVKSWNNENKQFQVHLGFDWLPFSENTSAQVGISSIIGYSPHKFKYRYNMKEQSQAGHWIDHHYACNNNGCLVYDPDKGGSWTQHFFQFGLQLATNFDFHLSKRTCITLRAVSEITYNWQVAQTIKGDTDNWFQKKDDYYDFNNPFNLEVFLRYKI